MKNNLDALQLIITKSIPNKDNAKPKALKGEIDITEYKLEIIKSDSDVNKILSNIKEKLKEETFDVVFPPERQKMFSACVRFDMAKSTKQIAVVDPNGNIVRLYLSHLQLQEIPKEIFEFQNLELLCLYDCQIRELPKELVELKKIKILFLQDNNIRFIPKEIVNLPFLEEFHCLDNPLSNLPREIAKQGLLEIRNYFESLENTIDTTYLYEAKLVFVGRGFAGKTSLVKKLTNPNYKLEKDIKSTVGIDIKYWDLRIPLEKSDSFRFNIWDFGGQEKYDATHQFFITERTLYIFVTEARQESNYLDFDYWLNVIQILGSNSPVIIVQNKIDLRKKNLPTDYYKQLFPNILTFVDVSCSDGYEVTINNLIAHIKSAVKNLPQVGDTLPKEWVDIRNELKTRKVDYITYSDYLKLCTKFGLSQEKADFLSRYYHDLGVIVHYSKDPLLKKIVVINPDWAVDGAYCVLDTRSIEENKGKFNNSDLDNIWDHPKYKNKHPELLALMKNYELCFELGNSGVYIAPELLPANPVQFTPISKKGRLTFIYHYKFMPAGIMTRFIVKSHKIIEKDEFWKHGVLLQYEGARALITEDEVNRNIKIEIEGRNNKKELLAIIREGFFEIHNDFKRKVQIDEFIPCICKTCKENEAPHLFKWETIKKYYHNGIENIRCDESLIEVNVKELIGEISDNQEGFSNTIAITKKPNILTLESASSMDSNLNYFPLLVGLSWWGILLLSIILFAFTKIDRFYLITFLVAFVITFPIIIAFTLVDKKSLTEENFITILKMSFSKIPGLQWINNPSGK